MWAEHGERQGERWISGRIDSYWGQRGLSYCAGEEIRRDRFEEQKLAEKNEASKGGSSHFLIGNWKRLLEAAGDGPYHCSGASSLYHGRFPGILVAFTIHATAFLLWSSPGSLLQHLGSVSFNSWT